MRRVLLLALGVVVLAIAAWQLMSLLEAPPAPAAVLAHPVPMRATKAARPPVEPIVFATVRGVVRDEGGTPVAKARVCASLERCTSTAATGTYELVQVPTTTGKIAVAAPRFQPRVAWIAALADGEVRTVDLVLDSGGVRVHGRVIDLGGQAIAGAVITEAVIEGVDTTSRADGTFELWVAPGLVRLRARAAGYAPSTRRVDPPAQIDLVLEPASTVAGIVVDENGAPVGGARVAIREADEESAVTAEDGTFRLVGLAAGSYQLRAQRVGLAGQTPVMVGTGEQLTRVEIRVGEAFEVGVMVKQADGTPCPEATVALLDHGTPHGGRVGIARKQPGGSVIAAVPAGTYTVSVGCAPAVSMETLVVTGDIAVTYTVEAPPVTGTLRVTVETPGRVPGEGDGLFLAVKNQKGPLRSVTVPGHGVVVERVPPGVYRLRVVSTSNEGNEDVVTVRADETTEKVMRIAPPTMGRLRATAVDADGRTLTDVALTITGPKVERTMRTLSDGSVTMYLPAGDYDISHARASVPAHVTSGASREVRLTVVPTAIVRGIVVDAADRPVPGAIIARINPQASSDQARVDARAADASGAFRFPVVGDAPITLVATRIGGGESPSVQTDGRSPVTLVIGGGATLSGSVVSADGTAVPRFTVTIADVAHNMDLGEREFANGRFTWSNLGAGEHRVVIQSRQQVVRDRVTIAADARTATIAMALPRTVTLTGRVVDAVSREPLPNAKVHLQHDTDATAFGGSAGRSHDVRTTDATGRFSFDDLEATSYQLEVIADAQHLVTSQAVNVLHANVDLAEIAVARARR